MAAVATHTPTALAEWETKYHKDVPWDTTSDAADLDAEVAAGARILKYADGGYVRAIHRQYPKSCGPACLAIVLEQLGLTQLDRRLALPRRLDGGGVERVDVGYVGSMEHLMWLGYHRFRLEPKQWEKRSKEARFASAEGVLNASSSRRRSSFLGPDGEMGYLSYKTIPNWLWHGPGVGTGGDRSAHFGLTGIMNYIIAPSTPGACQDALPLTTRGGSAENVCRFRRIFKGYIDHGISFVLGIESGGHFNTVIGYRGDPEQATEPFYVYTAEPLDGWGRPKERLPGRWRRMNVVSESMFGEGGLIYQMICWNHSLTPGWAQEVDAKNGNRWLTGRRPPATDPLRDPLEGRFREAD